MCCHCHITRQSLSRHCAPTTLLPICHWSVNVLSLPINGPSICFLCPPIRPSLVLWQYCITLNVTLLPGLSSAAAPTESLHRHCTVTAPLLHCHCDVTALSYHRHYTVTAPALHCHFNVTASSLNRLVTGTALSLRPHCTVTARHCTVTAPPSTLSLHSHCVVTALSLRCHYAVTSPSLHRHPLFLPLLSPHLPAPLCVPYHVPNNSDSHIRSQNEAHRVP